MLALVLAFIAVWVCFAYIGMTHTPIGSIDISPGAQPEAWSFTLADGTELTPDDKGNFALPSADATVFCTRPLTEYENEMTVSSLLALNARGCDAAVFADGKLTADPTRRFNAADGTFAPATGKGTNGGLFSLGMASEVTIAACFLTENTSLNALPSVEIFIDGPAYYSQWMSAAAESALPAGIFLAMALFLMGLFLLQLYRDNANWGFLLLSLLSLAFCLQNTVPYSANAIWFLQTPVVAWGIQVLPTLIILWLLWYHTSGKARRSGWLLPALCAAAAISGIIWRLMDNAAGAGWTNLVQGKLLPIMLLIALLWCGWEAHRNNSYYLRFFRWGGCLAACAGVITLISFLRGGSWWRELSAIAKNVSMLRSFYQPMQKLNHLLLLLFFLLAVYDFIESILRRSQELQALTLQNRYTAEHAAYLRRSLDETHALRHEIRHHIEALGALCREGDVGRIGSYVEKLGGELGKAPTRYTDNALVNALVSSCALRAQELQADFDAVVQVPEQVAIEDADLAVLLSNMIDNALEALPVISDAKDRHLNLRVEVYEDIGLFISCTNSFAGKLKRNEKGELLSNKNGDGHGLGLKAMRRIAERYNSVLIVEDEGNIFLVKTHLYFKHKTMPYEGFFQA